MNFCNDLVPHPLCVCVRASVRACVRACMRVRACVCMVGYVVVLLVFLLAVASLPMVPAKLVAVGQL